MPTLKDKTHPLHKFAKPCALVPYQYTQPEAKAFCPSGTIWRSPKRQSWQTYMPPHRTHTESWAAHGGDTFVSLRASLQFVWRLWLIDYGGLPESDDPIAGFSWSYLAPNET